MKPIVCLIIVSLIVSFASSDLVGAGLKTVLRDHAIFEQSVGKFTFQSRPSSVMGGIRDVWAEWLCPAGGRGWWGYKLWQRLYKRARQCWRQVRRWYRLWQAWHELLEGTPESAPVVQEALAATLEPANAGETHQAVASQEQVAADTSQAIVEVRPPVSRRRGRSREIATNHVACPNEECTSCGVFGPNAAHDIVGAGSYTTAHGERRQMFLCNVCQRTFSETAGTPFFGLKTPMQTVCVALQELAEGLGIRAVARIHAVEPDTVLSWLRKAGQHCEQVSAFMLQELEVSQVQLDELWTFVHKKERMLSEWEKLHTEYGDTWIWTAFDPVNKLVLAVLVGERTEAEAVGLVQRLRDCLAEACLPLLTSDALPHYASAILQVFGVWIQPERRGKRGPHPQPRQVEPDGLKYAIVKKQHDKGRVVSVTTRVVYGCLEDILACLEPLGHTINTSFVERMNLTLRHLISRLHRKTLCFSKKRVYLKYHLHLALAYYHFGLYHSSLRERLPEPLPTRGSGSPKLWQQRTPAMAAGLTDHRWSIEELLTCRVPAVTTP